MKLQAFLILLVISGMIACNRKIDLPNFAEAKWKKDQNGCHGIRLKMINDLKEVKAKLKGLNEEEIVYVLGLPDKNNLYKRNQKFFVYEITNAPVCTNKTPGSPHVFLSIRFNATKRAKEVMIYRE